jgi:hypothetical protein
MQDEYNLLVKEFNTVIGFHDSIVSTLQQGYSAQLNQIETIQDPEQREIARLNLLQSHHSGFASPGSVQDAIHGAQQNLNIIHTNKAIDQANERFEKAFKALWQRIEQDFNNEALWLEYLSLLNGEDARRGLTPDSIQSLKSKASKGLEDARENNRLSKLFKQYKEQADAIFSRMKTAPIEARQDLVALLNSEVGQLLSVENREALLATTQRELEELVERQRKTDAFKSQEKKLLDKFNEDSDIKAYITGLENLLLGDDATAYTESWRENRLRVIQGIRETWQSLESDSAESLSSSYVDTLVTALEAIGRGEDPITQGIERGINNLVRISYEHFPEGTETILNTLGSVDKAVDAVVEFIDDSTGGRASAVWQELDESTQARILGAGKLLSVVVPVTKIKTLTTMGKLPWTSWKNYPKITVGGREYAQVGDRLYTHHAVDLMQPSGLGKPAGARIEGTGRSFPPSLVDDVIKRGTTSKVISKDGTERTIHSLGSAEVVTEQGGKVVITVNPFRGR